MTDVATRVLIGMCTLGCAACGRAAEGGNDPPRETPQLVDQALVRYHMQRHFEDLRTVERLLVSGNLDDAKALAFMLSKSEADPGLAPWAAQSREVVSAARALAAARNVDEALRREARVAAACGDCHLRTYDMPMFEPPAIAPPDRHTVAARMARHQWAVDRIWESMVGASDQHWRAGLDVLATTPLPFAEVPDAAALGNRLQVLARAALAKRGKSTSAGRATTYGELLVTCERCHAALPAK